MTEVYKLVTVDNYALIGKFIGALNEDGMRPYVRRIIHWFDIENRPGRFFWVEKFPEMYTTVTDAYIANRAYGSGEGLDRIPKDPPRWDTSNHDHRPVQHRDGKPPWCRECGLTANGEKPLNIFNRASLGRRQE